MNVKTRSGKYVKSTTTGESFLAFIPKPLPPDPPLELTNSDLDLLEKANRALGRLDGMTSLLPDVGLLIYSYIRKEALLSSQIEGTQSSLADLLLYEIDEAPGVPMEDVEEVSCYVSALNYGLTRLREGFPLSLRLLREIHGVLLSSGRGSGKAPGEFRRSQNWIGGSRPGNARFVPPPPEAMTDCLSSWEKFLHDDPVRTPVLIKAARAHVQFETIHPFLDGNGRLGRLLITLLLCAEGALSEPTLYLSLYLKSHRDSYYDLLDRVRTEGDWEEWIRFFLRGVLTTAEQAVEAARAMLKLFEDDQHKIGELGRAAPSALRVHELMRKSPLLTIPHAVTKLGLSTPTVTSALKNLEKLGLVRELTQRSRNRMFAYEGYLRILSRDTEPIR